MTAFRADLDELEAVVASLAACARRLEVLEADLAGSQQRGQATWSGLSAEAQAGAWTDWQRGSTTMRDALDRMRVAADHARRHYASAADLNVALWAQVR